MIAGIILAAGASSRMGTPKALLEYRGETFLDRLIRVLGTVCDPVIVVLGYHADTLRSQVSGRAKFVVNPDPDRGQLSSLQTGLAAVPENAEGFMFLPVDCPTISEETVRAIALEAHQQLVIPRFDGRRGHPLYARRELIAEFLGEQVSAKDVVRRHDVVYIDTSDEGVLNDIDDPEAYRILQESL